jgi:hypothetical protein
MLGPGFLPSTHTHSRRQQKRLIFLDRDYSSYYATCSMSGPAILLPLKSVKSHLAFPILRFTSYSIKCFIYFLWLFFSEFSSTMYTIKLVQVKEARDNIAIQIARVWCVLLITPFLNYSALFLGSVHY